MRVEYTKHALGWRWRLLDEDDQVVCGAVRFFRTKFFCRRDCKKRYVTLQKKRPYWPDYRELD